MKPSHLLLFVFALVLFSCKTTPEKTGSFNLLPHPQQFSISGNSELNYTDITSISLSENASLPVRTGLLKDIQTIENSDDAQIVASIDESLDVKAEGYKLSLSGKKINITAKDQPGLMYAMMSLEQLMQDAKDQEVKLPACEITDYPALAYRAIHWDVKHHREKTEYYYQLLDKLQKYKINGIIAEVEDKLGYERQPLVASEDAISMEEWKKISDYAKERNIEISPLVQGLGHASFILKHDQYKELRDDPESDWAFNPLDSNTYKVQFDLYLDAMEAMPYGKYLHIGGDEVHTTGRGSDQSPLELQLIWLDKVSKFAAEHGKTPIFWDDMPLKHAGVYRSMFNSKLTRQEVDSIWAANEHNLLEYIDMFPKNCIYMRWNYSNSDSEGNAKAMEWFMEHDLQVMGATAGQTRWVLMPQEESNMNNIRSFASASIENNLNGLLLTLWDDDSPHFELYMRGILAFSEYSWTGDQRSKDEIKAAFRQREFGPALADASMAFIDDLEMPVADWKNILLSGNHRNRMKTNENAMEEMVIAMPDPTHPGQWSENNSERLQKAKVILETNEIVKSKIDSAKGLAIRNQFRLKVYEQVNSLTHYSAKALILLENYDKAEAGQAKAEALEDLKEHSAGFTSMRNELEKVYGQTRILTKPDDYILDQDHHVHLANQSRNMDWLFYSEMMFLEKVQQQLIDKKLQPDM